MISRGTQNLESWIFNPILNHTQIILVHDSSDGESFLPIEKMCRDLNNVILIEDYFSSPGLARNRGLEIANRPWIAFWDFDDLPDPEKFLIMLQSTMADRNLVGVGAYKIQQNGKQVQEQDVTFFRSESPRSLQELMINPGLWRWVFAREIIENVRFQALKRGEDQLFLAEISAFEYPITFSENTVYTYFIGDKNQLSNKKSIDHEMLIAARQFFNLSLNTKGETHLFTSVACAVMILSYVKRSIRNLNVVNLRTSMFLTAVNLFKNPQTLIVLILLKSKMKKSYTNQNKVINLYLAGGLGNQLFQIAYTSKLKGVRLLRLHQPCPDLCELISIGLLESWLSRNPGATVEILQKLSLRKRLARNQGLRLSGKIYNRLSFRQNTIRFIRLKLINIFLDSQSRLVIPNGIGQDKALEFSSKQSRISLVGYFQSLVYAEYLVTDLMKSLETKFGQSNLISDYLKELRKPNALAIHIRLGDYLEQKNASIGVVSQDYFRDSVSYISSFKTVDKLILFSNEPELAVRSLSHTRSENLTIIPLETSVLESLFLMSSAQNLIISNSTFSWWGAILPGEKHKTIIAPAPWFKEIADNLELIPSEWLRLDAGW